MKKYHSFSSTEFIDDPKTQETIGNRGMRVMELASLGAPILPGFIVSNETIGEIAGKVGEMKKFIIEPMTKIERLLKKKFNDERNPLLIKVVESPMLNMIQAFSIHNIGLCDKTVGGFATFVGEEFAYHEYRNVIRKIIELELKIGVDKEREKKITAFAVQLKKAKKQVKVKEAFEEHKKLYPTEAFTNAYDQLHFIIELLHSYFESSSSNVDSCLLIQAMTFGNYGEESYFGSYFTRDIVTGHPEISGQFFINAFDATETRGKSVTKIDKPYLDKLIKIGKNVETHFKEIRQIRFTVENGTLWVIDQVTVPNKSTQAEIKTLLDLHGRKEVDDAHVISTIKPGRLSEILHSILDMKSAEKLPKVVGGIAGAVGAAVGRVCFTTEKLIKAYKWAVQTDEETNFILCMPATFAEDVKAIEVATGVISSEGGYASHAPVVARSLGKVALVYPEIKFQKDSFKIGTRTIKEGDYIALNVPYYDTPAIYFGKVNLIQPSAEGSGLLEFLDIVQNNIDAFDVHANADQPKDSGACKAVQGPGNRSVPHRAYVLRGETHRHLPRHDHCQRQERTRQGPGRSQGDAGRGFLQALQDHGRSAGNY